MDLTPTIQEIQAAGCESLRDIAAGLEEPIPPLTDREIPRSEQRHIKTQRRA
jgi:hypothetical protein